MASTIFLLNGLVCLAISLVLIYSYFKNYNNERIKKASGWFSCIFAGYALLSLLFFCWAFNIIEYAESDFNLIFSIVNIFTVIIFLRITYLFSKDKGIFYYLAAAIAITTLSLISSKFYWIISPFLYFILILLSIHFFARRSEFRRFGFAIVLYAGTSLLLQALLMAGLTPSILVLSFASFAPIAYFFIKDGNNFPEKISATAYKKEHGIFLFIRYFIFVLILFNLIMVSTLVIHETGHIAAAKVLGCKYRAFLFEEDKSLQTEVLCLGQAAKLEVALAGLAFTTIVAAILLFLGGILSRGISLLIFGIGTIMANKDFAEMGLSNNFIVSSSFLGLILIISGVVMMGRFRFNEVF